MPTTYNKINLTQGDYIYYYDTSLGAIVSRNWDIRGGSPTGATSFAVTARYKVPNSSGYGVGLTVTDNVNVTDSVFVPNAITVFPEIENFSLAILKNGLPVSSSDMSVTLTYQATGTIRPAPTGNYYYQWFIPGTGGTLGFTGSSKTIAQIVKSTSSWLNLTGSEIGSPYGEYTGSARITVTSPLGNVYTGTKAITYNKSGFPESFYFPNSMPFRVGVVNAENQGAGSPEQSYLDSLTPRFGLPGQGPVFAFWSEDGFIDNQSMHSHTEQITVYTPSWDFTFSGCIPGQMTGQLIVSGSILNQLSNSTTSTGDVTGHPAPLISRYTQGNYMAPGDIPNLLYNTFYYADTNSQWLPLFDRASFGAGYSGIQQYTGWNATYPLGASIFPAWSAASIAEQFNYSDFGTLAFASISSKSYDLTGQLPPASILGLTGGEPYWLTKYPYLENGRSALMGCVLPSNYFAGIVLEIYFNFYCSPDGNLNNATLKGTVTFRTGSQVDDAGTSYDGLLLYANPYLQAWNSNDVPYPTGAAEVGGGGFASLMGATFASNNLSPYFTVGASSGYQWRETAYVLNATSAIPFNSQTQYAVFMSSTFVQGVRFDIKDPYITSSKGTLPFGLTGPTYLLKVTITDNFSTGFNYPTYETGFVPPNYSPSLYANIKNYTAAQWMGLKQNFIVNPYQYVNGGTGGTASRVGIYFHG
jgi:hypothetical protein